MTRFGDFTLLEDLGRSGVADRYKAVHATQGGPFFLKVYTRLDPSMHDELLHRCEALIGKQHPNLARHLGHGVVEGLPFVVAPYLEGIDLGELSTSLLDRRVNIGLESVILVLADLTTAVGALHSFAPLNNGVPFMGHGDVSLHHVRVGPEGQIWLTGLTTPRGDGPGRPPEGRWDLAGVGALVYDLVPLLRGGAARPPLPPPFDRVVRRALGIGATDERITPPELVERLGEVSRALKLKPDRGAFAELVQRTVRVVEKKLAEAGGRPVERGPTMQGAPPRASTPPQRRSPADAIPSLDPVDRLPTLEPILTGPAGRGRPSPPTPPQPIRAPAPTPPMAARPAPILELEPLPVGVGVPLEPEATTQLVNSSRPPAPSGVPPTPWNLEAPIVGRVENVPPPASAPALRPAPPTMPPLPRPTQPPQPTITAAPPATAPSSPFLRAATPPPMAAPRARPPGPPSAPPVASLEDAASPHTDPRSYALPMPPRTPVETAASLGPSPFGDLPPDVDDGPTAPEKSAAPPLPRARPATQPPAKRPLLADPDEPSAKAAAQQRPTSAPPASVATANAALHEVTRDSTDPDRRAARAEVARRDRGVRALLARALVTEAAVQRAIEEHVARGGRVLEILVAHGATDDATIAQALAAESGRTRLPDDALRARKPPDALVRKLPQTYALARRVLPLSFENGLLVVAVADPFDQTTLDELKALLGANAVEAFVASRAALTNATVEAWRNLGIGMPGADKSGPRALLITGDDDKATRIGARLAQEGIRVEHVLDGATARDILAKRPPDVVICAHDVAGSQGVAALLLLVRGEAQTAELPFFVFGPRGDEELAARLLDLGADDFLTEPLKLEVLLAKVRRAVGKGRMSTESWALNDPSGAARVLTSQPPRGSGPPSLDEQTPIYAIPTVSEAGGVALKASEPNMLDSLVPSLDDLDDLPELPSDFGEVQPETPPAMPTGVMGTLRQMALPEIVQSLEMGRKTARVDLVPASGEKGMIAFEMGAIRYAECGALRGDDAFYQLARHKEGFFRIHYGDKPPAVNIEAPTTFLLLEAMRRMDEEDAPPGARD